MKKISILFLIFVLCFSMSACGNNKNNTEPINVENTFNKIHEESYALGLDYEKNGKFVEAINLFESIPNTSSLYENAQDRISACTSAYQDSVLVSMKELANAGSYEEIYKLHEEIVANELATDSINEFINTIKSEEKESICDAVLSKVENIASPLEQYYTLIEVPEENRTDKFNSSLETIKENVINHALSEMDKYFGANDYLNAANYVDNLPIELKTVTLQKKQREAYSLYVDYAIEKAEEMSKTSAQNAIDYLTNANNQWSDYRFTEKIASLEKVSKAEEFNNLIKIYATDVQMNSAGGITVGVSWVNKSPKEIKYIYFRMALYNRVNDAISDDIGRGAYARIQQTGPIPHGEGNYYPRTNYNNWTVRKTFTQEVISYDEYSEDMVKEWAGCYWDNVWYNYDGYYAKIVGVEIDYMDGTKYSLSDEEFFNNLGIINIPIDGHDHNY